MTIDISSTGDWPGAALSNFAPHAFEMDGERCASMEGLLQSLKMQDPDDARTVRLMVGRDAKRAGRGRTWQVDGLWWHGSRLDRFGPGYQSFLDEAFISLYAEAPTARKALAATGTQELTHSIGKEDPEQTVLTRAEFLDRLLIIRTTITEGPTA